MSIVLEIARLRAAEGQGEAMSAGIASAIEVLVEGDGCQTATALRGIEDPDAFVLHVTWDSVESHLAFRDTEAFGKYRAYIQDDLAGAPEFAHFTEVASAAAGS